MTSESLFCARIALLQFVANDLKHLLHVPVQSIPEIFLGLAPRLRSRILEIGGHYSMLVVHCFRNTIQLHYISVLLGSRRRAKTPCGDRTTVYLLT